MKQEPALEAAFRNGPMARWAEAFLTVLDRGVAREELRLSDATSLGAEAGPAILLHRWMISGGEIDEQEATAVVDDVMMPLLGRR